MGPVVQGRVVNRLPQVADVGKRSRSKGARGLPAAPGPNLYCARLGRAKLKALLRKARGAYRIVAFSLSGLSRRMLQAEARSLSCRNHARVSIKPSRNET
jgi:hypothetical protein